ncbi:RNA ligase [Streptomyces sp. NPDC021093]|uniref:phosphatase domain-containing protein n=1 Tax=Streptomyces sp. NPDC021093 TaxID=3365112 RepID=UPI0037B2E8C7
MASARIRLDHLMHHDDLAKAVEIGHVSRRSHPELPLSIYAYTRTCQYEQNWTEVTTRCRGLVVDDESGEVVALPLPKFFNASEHARGRAYAPALPDEPFEVYDKVDGSLGIVFHHSGRWHVASKGSFISEQATWARRFLATKDDSGLVPGTTYLAEILYPENRIVVNYGDRRDLVLLAAYGPDGAEVPLAEAAVGWQPIGSVVRVRPAMPLAELLELSASSTLPDGGASTGTDAEGFVVRFASGLRTKVKIAEYVRLHKVLTGITERDVWRGYGIQRFRDSGRPPKLVAQAVGCSIAEATGSTPLDDLLEQVPDEFDAWVRGVITRLDEALADRERAIDAAYATISHLGADRAAFARAALALPDREVRAAMFQRLEGKPTELVVWRALKPVTADPFKTDEDSGTVSAEPARPVKPVKPVEPLEPANPVKPAKRAAPVAAAAPALPVVHVMTGLPASGKTTAARALQAESDGRIRRVNLDDLRAMLDLPASRVRDESPEGRARSYAREQTVLSVQDTAVRAAVDDGFDVVVDNTHLTPHIPKRLKAAVAGQAVFVVHDFTDVPVDECVRRDAARDSPVGEDVIRILADKHAKARKSGWRLTADWFNDQTPVAPYVPDPALPSAVMCDIDGTLALTGNRGPFDFTRCGLDVLNPSVRDALLAFRQAHGDKLVLLSGRGEEFREQTEEWLKRHDVPYDELWMRPAKDQRRDDIVKAELFDAHVRERYAVRVSLDDRDRVVELWRRMGLPTWQVNYGKF